jgi:NAD(P)-dependent dehydrogenase (short-subunit alcohol dehydrogenase family)
MRGPSVTATQVPPTVPEADPTPDYEQLLRLDGRTAVVVGAAHGIGRQVAHALAAVGATTVCADKDAAAVAAVADEIGGIAVPANVTRREEVARVLDAARACPHPPSVIVDIVGVTRFKGLLDLDDDDWGFSLDLNARHAFLLASMGGALLKEHGGGSMVFIGSASGMAGSERHALYGMAKAGVISLTRSAAVELGPHGVRVNCVSPGAVWTPRMASRIGEEAKPAYAQLSPLGRVAYACDIASAVLFLASDLSSFITGQNLLVDGATTLRSPFLGGNF